MTDNTKANPPQVVSLTPQKPVVVAPSATPTVVQLPVKTKPKITIAKLPAQAPAAPSKPVKPVKPTGGKKKNDSASDQSDEENPASENSEEASSEPTDSDDGAEKFYVEFIVRCEDQEGNSKDLAVIVNFEDEDLYTEHAESGFDDIEYRFEDLVSDQFSDWTYTGEWEEDHVHGPVKPESFEGPVINID